MVYPCLSHSSSAFRHFQTLFAPFCAPFPIFLLQPGAGPHLSLTRRPQRAPGVQSKSDGTTEFHTGCKGTLKWELQRSGRSLGGNGVHWELGRYEQSPSFLIAAPKHNFQDPSEYKHGWHPSEMNGVVEKLLRMLFARLFSWFGKVVRLPDRI